MIIKTVSNVLFIFGLNLLFRYFMNEYYYLLSVVFMCSLIGTNTKYFCLSDNHNDYQPFFSLLVCAKNEEENIEKCLDNLMNIDYPNEKYEIIVINDNSTDKTLQILSDMTLPNNVKIVNRDRKDGFVAGVLNDGLDNISENSQVVGIIDSDCLVSQSILNKVGSEFHNFNGGLQIFEWHYNSFKFLPRLLHLLCIYENYDAVHNINFKVGHFFHTDNIKVFGKYNEKSLIEDFELSETFKKNNITIKLLPETLIYRSFPEKLSSIYSQQYRYALGTQIINYKKQWLQEDIIIPQIIVNEMILTLLMGDSVIISLMLFISLYLYSTLKDAWNNLYENSYQSAVENNTNRLGILSFGTISFFDKILSLLMVYFIFFIRLLPFYKLPLDIEEIKWNRD